MASEVLRAARRGNVPALARVLDEEGGDELVHERNGYGQSPLILAARLGHVDAVTLLLDRGAVVNGASLYGNTALMWACYRGQREVVKLLLERGADPAMRNRDGGNALMFGSLSGDPEVVRMVLRDGRCGVHDTCNNGETALWSAAYKGRVEAAKILMEGGSDKHRCNKGGKSPQDIAKGRGRRAVLKLFKWFDEEGERAYFLAKVRRLVDDSETASCYCACSSTTTTDTTSTMTTTSAGATTMATTTVSRGGGRSTSTIAPTTTTTGGDSRQGGRRTRSRVREERRDLGVPLLMRDRLARWEKRGGGSDSAVSLLLPTVQMAATSTSDDGGGDGGRMKRRKKRGREGEEDGSVLVRMVAEHVVMRMKEDVFRVLTDMMRVR